MNNLPLCSHSKTFLFQLLNHLAVRFYLQDDTHLLHQLILQDLRNSKVSTLDYIQTLDTPPKDLTGGRAQLSLIYLNENQRSMAFNVGPSAKSQVLNGFQPHSLQKLQGILFSTDFLLPFLLLWLLQ